MYACMHACMHACMYVCMYECIHACMHAWMHVGLYVYMHTCTPAQAHTTRNTQHARTQACAHTYAQRINMTHTLWAAGRAWLLTSSTRSRRTWSCSARPPRRSRALRTSSDAVLRVPASTHTVLTPRRTRALRTSSDATWRRTRTARPCNAPSAGCNATGGRTPVSGQAR